MEFIKIAGAATLTGVGLGCLAAGAAPSQRAGVDLALVARAARAISARSQRSDTGRQPRRGLSGFLRFLSASTLRVFAQLANRSPLPIHAARPHTQLPPSAHPIPTRRPVMTTQFNASDFTAPKAGPPRPSSFCSTPAAACTARRSAR